MGVILIESFCACLISVKSASVSELYGVLKPDAPSSKLVFGCIPELDLRALTIRSPDGVVMVISGSIRDRTLYFEGALLAVK